MSYRAIVYDMDGTLLDTGAGILASVRRVLEAHGAGPLPDEVLCSFVGPPVQASFERVLGLSRDEAWDWGNEFRAVYQREHLFDARLYDGIMELSEQLAGRGIPQAIATNKRCDYAERVFTHFGLDRFIGRIFGTDMEGRLTKADLIAQAVDYVDVPRESAIMVGDTRYDAAGAAEAGVPFVGVTYGYGFASAADVDEFDNIGVVGAPREIMEFFS